jgi:WD40 repeat protein
MLQNLQSISHSADEQFAFEDMKDTWRSQGPRFSKCYHVAISGKKGRIMILGWNELQPLASIPAKGVREGVCDLKFTPQGAARPLLAAASHDQNIYIYNVSSGYQ